MLDSVLSLGVTSVITDMIHIHAEDVNPPMLTAEQAKKFIEALRMPEDDVHLITMNDYQFIQKEKSVKEMRDKMTYVKEENPQKKD